MPFIIPATVKAVFFDLNGTLIRDKAAHVAAFNRIFDEFGISLTPDERERKVANKLNRDIWPAVFERHLSAGDIDALSATKERIYFSMISQLAHPVPGSRQLIERLKQRGIHVGLVTIAPPEGVAHALEYLGLEGAFDSLVTSEDVRNGKPDPEAYLLAAQRAGVATNEALVFEDSLQGVVAAVTAGIQTVGIISDCAETVLRVNGATAIINDFFEVAL